MIEAMKRPIESDYTSHVAYTRALEQYCDSLESQEPVPTIEVLEQEIYQNTRNFVSLDVMEWMLKRYYTHPPQRTWVGLDHHDKKKFSSWLDHKSDDEVFTAIEAKLKELNT